MVEWVRTTDEQPKKSGGYWCQVLPSPFGDDKQPYVEVVEYDAVSGEWDTPTHMPVLAWDRVKGTLKRCTCGCHKDPNMIHMVACCWGGWTTEDNRL